MQRVIDLEERRILEFLNRQTKPFPQEDIPQNVSGYQQSVMDKLVDDKLVDKTTKYFRWFYAITPDGKQLLL